MQESTKTPNEKDENRNKYQENVLYNAQYRELIALINYQREKLSNQQADLTKVKYSFYINNSYIYSKIILLINKDEYKLICKFKIPL